MVAFYLQNSKKMVKIIISLLILFVSIQVSGQTDTLSCEDSFEYYDTTLGEKLIVIWDTPPSIKKCSLKNVETLRRITKDFTNKEYILVDMIIDSIGKPKCYRFHQKLKPANKAIFVDELKKLRFKPAQQKGKGIESIYTLKI